MKFRHWYWIVLFVLFIRAAITAFTSGEMGEMVFGYLFLALSVHAIWLLMIGHPTVFEREYWDSIGVRRDDDE